ncbi:hypothetical protein EVJ50_09515 [Synechococcus sp. RSCCF101]|uniref:ABC transporter permease n=1 Tax=Synechococcus sp. RSCCF101 TaxID=2511069 RepID=UPI001245D73B|nr:ABC transporter permease [Synechococcus sp. RSCCF101]QEY32419.1 hypothetical protein EVJ50_09515 [Synechococcus sp. RSCCF101]
MSDIPSPPAPAARRLALPAGLRLYLRLLPAVLYGARLRLIVQFSRTRLGSRWIGISTVLSAAILGTIYGNLTGIRDWPSYAVYVAVGLIAWNTLSTAITGSCTLMERSRERLLNQPFPPGLTVIEEWLTICLGALISLAVGLALLALIQPLVLLHFLAGGWLGLANLLLACLWIAMLLAPLSARLADLPQIMPILLQIAFLSSPILFYSRSLGPLQWVAGFNPLYAMVQLLRAPLTGEMAWGAQLVALAVQIPLALLLLLRLDRQRMRILRWL